MAAIVAAGAGVTVVKHGNRSASSQGRQRRRARAARHPARPACRGRRPGRRRGRHHVLLRRGVPPRAAARRDARAASSASARRFNFLGPIANPAKPQAQAIGCADRRMAPVMAGVFARRGVDAWVFRGDDGLDELTTTTTSSLWAVTDGEVVEHTLDPAALGIPAGTAEGLRGQDAAYNADVVRRVLAGETGPVRDAVLLNAGAALAVHAAEPGSTRGTAGCRSRPGHRGGRLRRSRGDPRALGRRDRLRLRGPATRTPVLVAVEARAARSRGRPCWRVSPPLVKPSLPEHVAATPHELAGGEVAVSRGHVVQLHARDAVTVVAHQHQADGLVAALHQEGRPARCRAVPDEVGLELQDVGAWTRMT